MAGVSEVALDHGPTRRRLDGVRRAAWVAVVGGIVATALAVGGLRGEDRAEQALRATLVPTTGRVTQVLPAGMLDAGSLQVRVEGRTRVVPADVERESWSPGDEIALLVSPTDPTVIRRADVPGRSGGSVLVVLLLLGPAATVAGAVAARRERRWRRVLTTHPWEQATGTYHQRPGRLLRVELALDERRVRLERTPRWLVAPLEVPGRATFLVAGAGDRVVVSRPGIPTIVGAREVAGAGG